MRFKVDENLPAEISELLCTMGHDSLSVLDQQLGGQPDSKIADVCKAESRIMITLDTDFCNILAYPPCEYPGIIVIRTDDQATPVILDCVRLVVRTLKLESPARRLWIVERGHIRVRGV